MIAAFDDYINIRYLQFLVTSTCCFDLFAVLFCIIEFNRRVIVCVAKRDAMIFNNNPISKKVS